MKILVTAILLGLLSGCATGWNTDVSDTPPHKKLTGTVWELKTDAYIIEYGDHRGMYYIIPNTDADGFSVYLGSSIAGKPYNEDLVGLEISCAKIIGGLRAGERLEVVRVVKNSHIEMGVYYYPFLVPKQRNRWTGVKQLNGKLFYNDRSKDGTFYHELGILNPAYLEQVEIKDANNRVHSIADSARLE